MIFKTKFPTFSFNGSLKQQNFRLVQIKAFADNKINVADLMISLSDRAEIIGRYCVVKS